MVRHVFAARLILAVSGCAIFIGLLACRSAPQPATWTTVRSFRTELQVPPNWSVEVRPAPWSGFWEYALLPPGGDIAVFVVDAGDRSWDDDDIIRVLIDPMLETEVPRARRYTAWRFSQGTIHCAERDFGSKTDVKCISSRKIPAVPITTPIELPSPRRPMIMVHGASRRQIEALGGLPMLREIARRAYWYDSRQGRRYRSPLGDK